MVIDIIDAIGYVIVAMIALAAGAVLLSGAMILLAVTVGPIAAVMVWIRDNFFQ